MTLDSDQPLAHWAFVGGDALGLGRALEDGRCGEAHVDRPTTIADLVPAPIDAAELAQLVSDRLVNTHRNSITSGVRADGTGRQSAGGGRAHGAYVAPEGTPGAAWQGWGTALKPAQEPIVLARRPLVGTIAANVLRYGTAVIHVDACRVESNGILRWPANLALDQLAAERLDEQAGAPEPSRFFYGAKVSTSDGEAGLEAFRKATDLALEASLTSPRRGWVRHTTCPGTVAAARRRAP